MAAELVPIVAKAVANSDPTDAAKPLREAIGGTLAEVWQGIVGDRIAAWRLANAAEISGKLTKRLAETGLKIDTSRVSERYAFTWFEEASKQDEPAIQELFATLLTNAATGNGDALEQRNLEIVSRMSGKDAKLLSIILDKLINEKTLFGDGRVYFEWPENQFLELVKRDHKFDDFIALENLTRLGVIDRYPALDTTVLQDHIERVSSAIENQSSKDLPQFIWRDLVDLRYNLTLSLTGYSLAKALAPEKFVT